MQTENHKEALGASESLPGHKETHEVYKCKQVWTLRCQEPLSSPITLRESSKDPTPRKPSRKV